MIWDVLLCVSSFWFAALAFYAAAAIYLDDAADLVAAHQMAAASYWGDPDERCCRMCGLPESVCPNDCPGPQEDE